MTEQFVAGIVGAPFGLKGFVKVKPLSGETGHLLKLRSAVLRRGGEERRLEIEESEEIPPAVVMRFSGFGSPEAARALGGWELLVGREDAAALLPGEFYVEDLKGLAVLSGGEVLGHITDIIEGGGGDLAEITLNNGEHKFVPFRQEFLNDIDLEESKITLNQPWILE